MSRELAGQHVLIVDDIAHNRYLLRMTLANAGCIVHEAGNGREAMDILKKEPVGLIISDILMPEMDGYALCRACKEHPEWQNIPFVFYTATYTTKEDEAFA
ncbi:MAG: response regulator, partial [Deltaproteobacteria bacterium]